MFNSEKCVYTGDLKALIIFASLAVIFVLISPFNETPFRVIFALILIFFIPGYAFMATMFPKKDEVGGIERFTLSVGFSIVIMVFDGLAVSLTEWKFRPNSISISLFLLTLIFVIGAYVARRRLHESEQFTFSISDFIQSIRSDDLDFDTQESPKPEEKRRFWTKGRPRVLPRKNQSVSKFKVERVPPEIEKALIIALVGSIIIASGMLAYAKITHDKETFTALYILGPDGKAENYPTTASLGSPITVTVGIENYELRDVDYILQMRLDGDVLQEMNVSVKDGDKWLQDLAYTPSQMRQVRSKLEFVLFKEDVGNWPYRSVHLWILHNYSADDPNGNIKEIDISSIPVVVNGDMEFDSGWIFSSTNDAVNASYNNESGIHSSKAYLINNSYEGTLIQWGDQYHDISQELQVDEGGVILLSAFVNDNYSSAVSSDTQFKQVLINDVIVWEDGMSGDEGWQHVQIPVMLSKGNNSITLRLAQKGSSDVYPVELLWDDISFQPISELSPLISDEGTVESTLPTSKVLPLSPAVDNMSFTVEWNGTDLDSGISLYSIDYSTDGVKWKNWISSTEYTSATFTGEVGKTYYFRSKAVDKAGNKEMDHMFADTSTTIDQSSPKIDLEINPNPSWGLARIVATSSEPLNELSCFVTSQNFASDSTEIQMGSSDSITWTGEYAAGVDTIYNVEVVGKDLANNTGFVMDTLLVDLSLDDFIIDISPDSAGLGIVEIKVIPAVALRNDPSITVRDSRSNNIEVDSLDISGNEYIYTVIINSTLSEGAARVDVSGYAVMNSERITGMDTFVIDFS